jgi:hypothetical protein
MSPFHLHLALLKPTMRIPPTSLEWDLYLSLPRESHEHGYDCIRKCENACLNAAAITLACMPILARFWRIVLEADRYATGRNLFFSVYLLGESLKRRHVASTLLIVIGNVLIVAWGDHQRQKITLTLVLKLVASPPFLVYMAVVYSLAIAIGTAEYCSRSKNAAQGKAGLGALSYALSSAMVPPRSPSNRAHVCVLGLAKAQPQTAWMKAGAFESSSFPIPSQIDAIATHILHSFPFLYLHLYLCQHLSYCAARSERTA